LINDISGGNLDKEMFKLMALKKTPVVLMHMRGTPKTMSQLTDYENNDVIADIRQSLLKVVQDAITMGIRRWNIILDPGIGFAKDAKQNFDILKNMKEIVNESSLLKGFPLLCGPSRKGFIGKATEKDVPADRVFGTAAAITASVMNGARVVRVHDVAEMRDVVKVADLCK
jgi:dihydroneopterin aldolase/2-amino-4-hydroxy-6-hydroxymethyldihydropteridine diphosphokinase/dihydropteroate synthase